jgi:hypothetical protein
MLARKFLFEPCQEQNAKGKKIFLLGRRSQQKANAKFSKSLSVETLEAHQGARVQAGL